MGQIKAVTYEKLLVKTTCYIKCGKYGRTLVVLNLPVGTACPQIKMAARTTDASSSTGIYWPDRVLTLLLDAVR